jgi:hypothetical protein
MSKFGFLLTAAALVILPAAADECAWNAKSVADAAVRLLPKGTVIQEFCKPCNDTKAKRVVVDTVSIKVASTSDPDSHVVVVNGQEIDLAYVFVQGGPTKGEWVNLGLQVKCGVPGNEMPTLPPQFLGT